MKSTRESEVYFPSGGVSITKYTNKSSPVLQTIFQPGLLILLSITSCLILFASLFRSLCIYGMDESFSLPVFA